MTSPEGRWWKVPQNLGDALRENQELTRRYEYGLARNAESLDLARKCVGTEVDLQMERAKLDLVLQQDRRARSAHERANEIARLRGASPDTLAPYLPDPRLAEAQAEFDVAEAAHRQAEKMLQDKESELRYRYGVSPT